nr:hypothetical protein [uncultured Butyrivibrio sp.]
MYATAYTYDYLDNLQSIHRVEGLISDDEREGKSFPTVGKANAGLGLSEMYFGLNVMMLGGAMYADNVTGIGVLDDIWATGLEAGGLFFWLDGWRKIVDSVSFCEG